MPTVQGDDFANVIYQDDYGPELDVYAYGGNDRVFLNITGTYGGFNFVVAGSGNDEVYNDYEGGNDIDLGTGNDYYVGKGFSTAGGDYYDIVYGYDGNDVFDVVTFHSDYYGERDNDTFYSVGFNNLFNGGDGIDVVSYERQDSDPDLAGFGIHLDLRYESASTIGTDYEEILINIENAVGTGADDEMYGSSIANSLWGSGGSDYINGDAGDDRIYGEAGNDILVGGGGADILDGGSGDDIFVLENGSDTVLDSSGVDTITSTITRSLTSYTFIENLALEGNASVNATGNTLSNTLTGNTGNNRLIGEAGKDAIAGGAGNDKLYGGADNDGIYGNDGNDYIVGGAGNDRLGGGAGSDTFVFDTAFSSRTNIDIVTDFTNNRQQNDVLWLDNAVFTNFSSAGAINADNFASNASGTAADSSDYLVYNSSTGDLYYDADGNGSGTATLFAQLSNKPAITHQDFLIV